MSVHVQYEDGTSTFINLQSRRFLDFTTSATSMDVSQLWYFDCSGEKVVLANDDDFAVFLENESPKTTVFIAQLQHRKRTKRYHNLESDDSLAMPPINIVQTRRRKSKSTGSDNNFSLVPTKTIRLIIDNSPQADVDETVVLHPFQDGNFDKLTNLLKKSLGHTSFKLYYLDSDKERNCLEDDDDLSSMMKEVDIIHVSLITASERTIAKIDIVVLIEEQNKTETVSIAHNHPPVYNVLYSSVAKLFAEPHSGIYMYYHDHDNECIILEDDNDFQNFLDEVKPPRLYVKFKTVASI